SARRNHLNPWAYLTHVLSELPTRTAGAGLADPLPLEHAGREDPRRPRRRLPVLRVRSSPNLLETAMDNVPIARWSVGATDRMMPAVLPFLVPPISRCPISPVDVADIKRAERVFPSPRAPGCPPRVTPRQPSNQESPMATRILSRRAMREQQDRAEQTDR